MSRVGIDVAGDFQVSHVGIVVVVVYVLWVAATVANQFHSRCPAWLKAIDVFGLIPVWTFFAPNPGMSDYYLLYRDRLAGGSFDNWRKVDLKGSENGARLALWNPTKRKHKALSDVVSALIRVANQRKRGPQGPTDAPHSELIATVPYILILNFITSRPHSFGADATQFMVMEHGGFDGKPDASRVLVMSEVHRLS